MGQLIIPPEGRELAMARGVNLETVHSVGVTYPVVRVAAEPAGNDRCGKVRPCVAPTGGVCPSGVAGRWLLLGRNMGQTGHIRDRLLLGPVRRWRNCRGITSLNTSSNSSSVRSAS
jgi:hypothetical protein